MADFFLIFFFLFLSFIQNEEDVTFIEMKYNFISLRLQISYAWLARFLFLFSVLVINSM